MIAINKEKCTGCKTCSDVCPLLAFNNDMTGTPIDCINCQQCGAACPHGAVSFDNIGLYESIRSTIQPDQMKVLIENRRSHRNFSPQKVEKETIESFLTDLRFSPTASNNQNLEFTVLADRSQIAHLNEMVIQTIRGRFKKALNPFTIPFLRFIYGKSLHTLLAAKQKFVNKSLVKHDMITYNAPVVIIVHAPTAPTGMPMLNAGIWTGMALLYAETKGLATCVNGYTVNALQYNKKLRSSLGIPNHHQVYSCLLLGYPKKKFAFVANRRKPVIHWKV
jgi:nitroreductase/NAD-dependent dihydropyrimidine dehydrogenase PreA subunit